jgi:uncharacterized protein YhaN
VRIGRLDLIRYGRFTDVSLPFARRPSDLHVIYGPNEAGKSTSLAAIEDWLFGIGARSPYNFLHEHASLRVGGVLEHPGGSLEVVRRKGNKDTLLTPEGTPLPAGDRALTPFLNGVTRELFTRMMSLDHERLTAGGREILEARNEVGQMLFAAGTGVSGLREQLSSLERTADELWAPRRAAHRKYYEALEALETAEKVQREQTVTATDWNKLKRALDEAQAAYEELLKDIETRTAEQRKLGRIRRVYRRIMELADIERELEELGEPAALPQDAESKLTAALTDQANANTQTGIYVGQLEHERAERGKLQCDGALLAQSEAIEGMHQRRIEVQKERSDLPKRQAELAAKERTLQELAEGLGWGSMGADGIGERLPPRARVTTARALLNERGESLGARNSAQGTLDEAKGQLEELKSEQQAMATPLDVSRLAAALTAARNTADVAGRIEACEREFKACDAKIANRLGMLRPSIASEETLTAMAVPPRPVVETHRDELHQLDQRVRDCEDRRKAGERELAQTRQAYERRAHAQQDIAPEALRHAREDRETGWRLIRRRYIEGREIPEPELTAFVGRSPDLPGAYEGRVQAVDTLADRRFENAQAAGEMAVLERQTEDQEGEIAKLSGAERELTQQRTQLESAWRALWAGADFEPLAPEVMLDWLSTRTEILTLIETREAVRSELSQLREKEADAKAGILAELSALGEPVEGLLDRTLSVVIEQAAAAQQRHETLAKERRSREERIRKGEWEVARKGARLQAAENQWSDWQRRWGAALTELGLTGELPTEAVTEQIDTLERMRTLVSEMSQLRRDRIEKIELDVSTFASAAADLVRVLAPDLAGRDADQAVLELERRLEAAKSIRAQQRRIDLGIGSLETRLKASEEARNSAEQTIQTLQTLAGAADAEQLKEVIRRAKRRGLLETQRAGIEGQLSRDGDGLPLRELQQECSGADLDQIASRERALEEEIEALQEARARAFEQRQTAQQAFDAVGGESGAIEAAAKRHEALASMRDVAERYVRTQTAAVMLRWAIDRFRRERQAPLLKRAGRLFAQLTSGSFVDLRVEYDAEDRPQLAGVRPDASSVGSAGMSDGTRDQLYLALRLASVEEYLDSTDSLPFVADDLLVNFDDERATAALRVLAQLGRRTQVLFFTHHQHLVDIARATLGEEVNVITLMNEAMTPAAA